MTTGLWVAVLIAVLAFGLIWGAMSLVRRTTAHHYSVRKADGRVVRFSVPRSADSESAARAAREALELDDGRAAADAIRTYIETQNLGISDLKVTFLAAKGLVILSGTAPSREASERAFLAASNVAGVTQVENNLLAPPATQVHHVVSGDTLSTISRE